MGQIRTLDEIKAEVNKIVTDREERIRLLMEQHDQAIQNEAAANEKAHAAYVDMDVKAYHKALDEARTNKDAAEMFLAKKAEIEGTPYIDKAKYKSLASEVFQYLDQYVQNSTEALTEPMHKLASIAEDTGCMLRDGNSFLQYLQLKIYKDDGVRISDDGVPIYMRSKKMLYDNYKLASLWERIRDESIVKELLGNRENKE